MDTNVLMIPTEFTVEQLETLRELALKANSATPSPVLHNLGVKLANYVEDAHQALRRHLTRNGMRLAS